MQTKIFKREDGTFDLLARGIRRADLPPTFVKGLTKADVLAETQKLQKIERAARAKRGSP